MATVMISRGVRDSSANPSRGLPAVVAGTGGFGDGRGVRADPGRNLPARIVGDVTTPTLVKHPKAILVAQGGSPTFVLPLAPVSTDADGYAMGYTTVDRPGQKPLVIANGMPARTLTFTAVLKGATSQTQIQNSILYPLRALAEKRTQFTIEKMGMTEEGWWRLSGLKITPTARQHGTNWITRANATFTFIEAVNFNGAVGPLTGGATAPAPAPAGPVATVAERYTVARGDTLQKISSRFYGTPNRWRDIAAASGIVNANLIRVGQTVTIPRP